MRNGLKFLSAMVVMLSLCGAAALFAAGPGDPDNKWRTKDKNGNNAPIEVTINLPLNSDKTGDPEAHYLPINHTLSLFASASDTDSYCKPINKGGDGEWYNYGDHVTSGTTDTNYHMWWEVATGGDGEFLYDPGPPIVNHKYGFMGKYTAPEYQAGANLRTVTVRAKADDFQRNGDTLGEDDAAAQSDAFEIKVWQVTVSSSQAGLVDTDNDAAQTPATGDPVLGWIIPNNPAGAIGYFGNTELKGTIPAGPGVKIGYSWRNEVKGLAQHKVDGGEWVTDNSYPNWTLDFDHTYSYADPDSRHPNTVGPDVRKIFALDGPGTVHGVTNDGSIGPPDNWTDDSFDMDFRTEVRLVGIPISNQHEWHVSYTLDVVNDHWHVVNHSP